MNSVEESIRPRSIASTQGRWLDLAGYRRYVIALIWVTLLLRFVDLQIMSVLLEAIRKEFSVSDTQLGLLSGFAFSTLYGALGIPVAWLSDRYDRRGIIACAVGLWSLMTALCGTAGGFTSLLLARIGVGVGEAGGTAPAYSLVAALVPADKRASVFAFLNTSVPAGVFGGFLVGGWVGSLYGWRAAFYTLGAVGIGVALIVRLTVANPPNEQSSNGQQVKASSILTSINDLLRIPSYRQLVLGSSIFTAGAMGSGTWITSFFIRVHHMQTVDVATWMALIYGCGGSIGAMLGGLGADRLVAVTKDRRWFAWLASLVSVGILPFAFCVYLWGSPLPALLFHIGTVLLMHAWLGPVYGTIQTLVRPERGAIGAALNLLVINLVAFGGGPLIVGVASDWLNPIFGAESLRYAILVVVVVTYLWASVHFLLAGRTLREDLARA